jgi:hypothetical protein
MHTQKEVFVQLLVTANYKLFENAIIMLGYTIIYNAHQQPK